MADLPSWLQSLLAIVIPLVPGLLWFLFCLWAIDWKKLSAVLREGGWVPASLLIFLVALVWSRIDPRSTTILGVLRLPNLWWQFAVLAIYAGIGLFAGWLQLRYSWSPPEISVEPPVHVAGPDHGVSHLPVPSVTHTEEHFQDTGGEH